MTVWPYVCACTWKSFLSNEGLCGKFFKKCQRELIVNNFLSRLYPSKHMPHNLSFDGTEFLVCVSLTVSHVKNTAFGESYGHKYCLANCSSYPKPDRGQDCREHPENRDAVSVVEAAAAERDAQALHEAVHRSGYHYVKDHKHWRGRLSPHHHFLFEYVKRCYILYVVCRSVQSPATSSFHWKGGTSVFSSPRTPLSSALVGKKGSLQNLLLPSICTAI